MILPVEATTEICGLSPLPETNSRLVLLSRTSLKDKGQSPGSVVLDIPAGPTGKSMAVAEAGLTILSVKGSGGTIVR